MNDDDDAGLITDSAVDFLARLCTQLPLPSLLNSRVQVSMKTNTSTLNAFSGVEVQLHEFLTLPLD
jgi:hypothetical protein